MIDETKLAPEVRRAISRRRKEQGKRNFDWGNTFEGYEFWKNIFEGKDMTNHIRYPKQVNVDLAPLVKFVCFIIGFAIGGLFT